MKKIFASLVAIALLFAFSGLARAATPSDYKYVIVNTTQTTLATAISTSYIEPGVHNITRFTVTHGPVTQVGSTATEVIAALYDSSTVGGAGNKQLEGEIESNDADSVSFEYISPLRLANGAVIMQGAHTVVTVEYEYAR